MYLLNYLFIYLIHIQNKILVLEISKSVKIGYEWRWQQLRKRIEQRATVKVTR